MYIVFDFVFVHKGHIGQAKSSNFNTKKFVEIMP